MKKITASILIATITVIGCAGRAANPVLLDQVGDNQKSCETLQVEMAGIQSQIQKLVPESDKTGKNVGLGIGGFFLLGIPWFFMDLSDAEKAEINAYNMRYNKLMTLATQKKCQFLVVTPDTPEVPVNNSSNSAAPTAASPARAAIMPPAKSMPTSDLPNPAKKLEDLNTMLKKGLITQDEYNAKKTEILNNM
jgi:hypothetical protein